MKKWLVILLALFAQQAFAVDYEYKKIAVGARWNQCEYSRQSALQWAYRSTDNEAHKRCNDMGRGWGYARVEFRGYESIKPCRDGRSFKAEINDAVHVCKKPLRR